jgi:hypothetical protein
MVFGSIAIEFCFNWLSSEFEKCKMAVRDIAERRENE